MESVAVASRMVLPLALAGRVTCSGASGVDREAQPKEAAKADRGTALRRADEDGLPAKGEPHAMGLTLRQLEGALEEKDCKTTHGK